MIIHHNIENFKAVKPVVTIGTFDGVHLGHREVIAQLKRIAQENGGESVIFTFYPHPRLVVTPDKSNLRLLTTLDEKIEQFERSGIDHLVVYPFTKAFADLSYREFINNILIEKMGLHTLVVGHDHHLGKNREGTFENIVAMSASHGFEVKKIEAFMADNINISSSKIRKALQNGEIEKANQYLGYRFSLSGKVTTGKRLGRQIGFPTANIEAPDQHKLIPAEGVYAVMATVKGIRYKAMLNIGYRPTVDANADHRTTEAHLIDFEGDIYQSEITLQFYHRVRDEQRFSSIETLKEQLISDRETILKILESAS